MTARHFIALFHAGQSRPWQTFTQPETESVSEFSARIIATYGNLTHSMEIISPFCREFGKCIWRDGKAVAHG